MLIDDVTIKVASGHGGKGAMAFNKNLMSLGPTGGSGGKGGDVYFEGTSDLSALNHFRYKKELTAENGGDGRSQFRDGRDGKDIILPVPIGTFIHDLTENKNFEILSVKEKVLIARGGRGGKGNFFFRSSRNISPRQFQEGLPGKILGLHLELKLIADIGLVGLPNVGKSSFLNAFTNAKSKVANYRFTTLEPNLGVYYELIIADIPGLIEGASEGKGLGIKFLRHIDRVKILFHFISAEAEDPEKDYKIIRQELGAYNKNLLKKKEYVFLSKSDLVSEKEIGKKIKRLKKIGLEALSISVISEEDIEKIKKLLNDIKKDKEID